ncbi:MAG: hypothetical protein FWE50_02005 [Alphaproteobacteria bacterium]|nr:hypothetical protein [Alphaproteobacteria bacterium]
MMNKIREFYIVTHEDVEYKVERLKQHPLYPGLKFYRNKIRAFVVDTLGNYTTGTNTLAAHENYNKNHRMYSDFKIRPCKQK